MKKWLLGIGMGLAASLVSAESVLIKTSVGDMTVQLYEEKSPVTVKNFLAYVDNGFYNGVIFHRVIDGFMIQTGGFGDDMQRKSSLPPIVNESNNYVKNKRGTLAMARTNDPNSATSQFFINHKNNSSLDYRFGRPGYAVFGEVTEGMQIVDAIAKVETAPKDGHGDVPVQPIYIESVTRIKTTDEAATAE